MREKNIFLIGPAGSGKSTIGVVLAEWMGYRHVDTDFLVENSFDSLSVCAIFEQYGEEVFREREQQILASVGKLHKTIVSTGGGIILHENNRTLMKRSGFVVRLVASLETLLSRLQGQDNRPLITTPDRKSAIQKQLLDREAFYNESADVSFVVDNRSVTSLVEDIQAWVLTTISST